MEAQQIEVGDEFQNDSGTITVEVVSGDTVVYKVGEDTYNEVLGSKFHCKLMKGGYEKVTEDETDNDDDQNKNFGSRPMTGQPRTEDSMTAATRRANAKLSEELENGEIEKGFSDKKMFVTENGERQSFTREQWENERSARTRVWDRLDRNGGVYVRIAHWYNDASVNKVKTGNGFYAEKVDETEKAYQFEVDADTGNHNAETEQFWVPKKAAQLYELR